MRWYDDVIFGLMIFMVVASPFASIFGWVWWFRRGGGLHGWRNTTSKLGVVYSTFIVALMVAFTAGAPKNSPTAAEFPYTHHWAPIIFRFSTVGLLFALAGKGWVRMAILISVIGGCCYAFMAVMML
jgi:hypothetical protein